VVNAEKERIRRLPRESKRRDALYGIFFHVPQTYDCPAPLAIKGWYFQLNHNNASRHFV
jgi:hypothetical protein